MDEETKEIDKKRWSYSKTTCFNHCKYEYYLNYIVDDDELYLSEGNFYAEIGIFMHEILAMIFKGKLSIDDAPRYFIDNFDDNVVYSVKKSTMDKAYDACLDYLANADFSWLKQYEIIGVEMEQKFKVDDIDFIGYIDLLLRDKSDNRIVILDHKSSKYPFGVNGGVKKSSQSSFDTYKKQMYLYCCAVYNAFNEFPKEIMWNHFKDGGRIAKIQFVKDDYDKTLDWFRKTVTEAKQEREFNPSQDFFYCYQLCNFRNSCEYKNNSEV